MNKPLHNKYETNQKTSSILSFFFYFGKLFKYAGWNYAYTWKEVYDCIKTLPVTNKYKIKFGKVKQDQLFEFLVEQHGLSERKVNNALEKIT